MTGLGQPTQFGAAHPDKSKIAGVKRRPCDKRCATRSATIRAVTMRNVIRRLACLRIEPRHINTRQRSVLSPYLLLFRFQRVEPPLQID